MLKCKNCGKDVGAEDSFCTYCGTSLKSVEKGNAYVEVKKEERADALKKDKETKEKSSKAWIIALITVLVVLVASIITILCFTVFNKGRKYSKKIEAFEEQLTSLTLTGDIDSVNKEIEICKRYIESKDYENADSSIAKIQDMVDNLDKENSNFVKNKIADVESIDQSYLEENDKKQISEKMEEIKKLISKKLYVIANSHIEELSALVYKLTEPENKIGVVVKQVDVSEYPRIRLYVELADDEGNIPDDLEQVFFHLSEKNANGEYVKKTVSKVSQLNEAEKLNINMVMDVSGSMLGSPLLQVKSIMNSFVDSVQFESGDLVELTTFNSGVNINCEFTQDEAVLKQRINALSASGMTSLYDALYLAVNRVATRPGAKCVIAFTDGLDNNSRANVEDVITQAKKYNIPIFLIGSDINNNGDLEKIATSTGGFYKNISSITSLKDVYSSIYRQQKELYLVEYEDENENLHEARNIKLSYRSKEYGGEEEYSFVPNILRTIDEDYNLGNGPEDVVIHYLQNFVIAITNKDFSMISDYLLPGSNIYDTQKEYINKDIEEKLLSYEILSVDMQDENHAIVSTRETYWITSQGKLIQMLTQECKYKVETSNGNWQLTDFADQINVVNNIKY